VSGGVVPCATRELDYWMLAVSLGAMMCVPPEATPKPQAQHSRLSRLGTAALQRKVISELLDAFASDTDWWPALKLRLADATSKRDSEAAQAIAARSKSAAATKHLPLREPFFVVARPRTVL
jgi:hypothetical protein